MLQWILNVTADRSRPIAKPTGCVADEVLTPAIKNVTPGIGKRKRAMDAKLFRSRVVFPDTGFAKPRQSVRTFDLRELEGAFLKVEHAAGSPLKRGDAVMRVGRIEADQTSFAKVCLVVAVGILHEQNVGLNGDVGAAVANLKSSRLVQPVSENFTTIGFAIGIIVFKNQDLVIEFRFRFPVRIAGHRGDPQTTFVIKVDRNRIREFRKLLF